jgi:hypothetical protein
MDSCFVLTVLTISGDMLTFYSVNFQHNYMEFEIRVGGKFSETMPPSPKDGLEQSGI